MKVCNKIFLCAGKWWVVLRAVDRAQTCGGILAHGPSHCNPHTHTVPGRAWGVCHSQVWRKQIEEIIAIHIGIETLHATAGRGGGGLHCVWSCCGCWERGTSFTETLRRKGVQGRRDTNQRTHHRLRLHLPYLHPCRPTSDARADSGCTRPVRYRSQMSGHQRTVPMANKRASKASKVGAVHRA